MILTYVSLAVVSFGLGIAAKYADLMNEHGMAQPFRGARYLSGLAWGACGFGMILVSPLAGLTYFAHVLYWFERVKLEFPNHAVAGVIIVLGGIYSRGDFLYSHRLQLVAVFLAYLLTGVAQTCLKNRFPPTRPFWRLRLRIYAIPFVYSLYVANVEPMIATSFGMLACEIVTYMHRELESVDIRNSADSAEISANSPPRPEVSRGRD
jgi:hypothetical protein